MKNTAEAETTPDCQCQSIGPLNGGRCALMTGHEGNHNSLDLHLCADELWTEVAAGGRRKGGEAGMKQIRTKLEDSLKPCPWCKAAPKWDRQLFINEPPNYRLQCTTFNRFKCGGMPSTAWYRTRSGARNAWNRQKH